MKRYILLAAVVMVMGACGQRPEIVDHSKPGNTKLDGDTNMRTNQVGNKSGVGQMIELRVIDDEMRVKLGLNNADDMLVTLSNGANKTQHTILYVSKDLDEEFMAAPSEFIHSKKLEKFVQIFALSEAQPPSANTSKLMSEVVPVPVAKTQSLTALGVRVFCKQKPNGNGGVRWIPDPPCPI